MMLMEKSFVATDTESELDVFSLKNHILIIVNFVTYVQNCKAKAETKAYLGDNFILG